MFESDDNLPPVLKNDGLTWRSTSEISNGLFSLSNLSSSESPRMEDVIGGFHGGFFLSGVVSLINVENDCARDFKGVMRDGLLEYTFYKKDGTTERVRINDLLPTKNGKLVFAQAPNNEFWCPLLEKAYAKFLGGYQYLSLGSLEGIIQPLTGNWLNCHEINQNDTILNWIRNECEKKNPVICKTKHSNGNNGEHGRGYAVIGVTISNNEDLISLRDPMKTTSETIRVEDFKRDFDLIGTSDQFVSGSMKKEISSVQIVGGSVRGSKPIINRHDFFGRNSRTCSSRKIFTPPRSKERPPVLGD